MALSNDLISQFAKMSKDNNKKESKETTVYGTIKQLNNVKCVKIDGSELLTPISSTTDALDGERVTVMIKDHKAIVNGNISSPAARTGTVKDIDDRVVAQGNNINAMNNNINAQNNNVTAIGNTVNAQNNKIIAMENNVTAIGNTVVSQGNNITQINDTITSQGNNITALNNDIGIYNSSFQIKDGVVTGIKGIKTDWIKTEDLEADHATITSLDTKYANIDFANIGKAAIENLYAKSGIIKDLTIGDTTVTGKLVGVTISGDLIEGNTIKADKLLIKGDNGLYYEMNVNALGEAVVKTLSAEEQEALKNGIHGTNIIAKSVTADKISVTDLVAFGATIAGFNLTDKAIYSDVKTTVDNTTRGIYLDKEGQVAFGDAANYIKFFAVDNDATSILYEVTYNPEAESEEDMYTVTGTIISSNDLSSTSTERIKAETSTGEQVYANSDKEGHTVYYVKRSSNKNYKLEISANSLTFGSTKRDIEDSFDNVDDAVNEANKKLSEALSLFYVVTYDEEANTYTLTDTSMSSSELTNISIIEGTFTTSGEQVYSGIDKESKTIYLSKIESSLDNVQNGVNDNERKITEAETSIQQLGNKIISTVTDGDGKTSLIQTGQGWTFNLDDVKETADDASDRVGAAEKSIGNPSEKTGLYGEMDTLSTDLKELSNKVSGQGEYITFYKDNGQPYLELGNSSNFKAQINNNGIYFLQGSSRVAYINNEQLYIERATVKQELEIGDNTGFIWKSRDNGNMGLQWFEREDLSTVTYTITYDANGGTGCPDAQTKQHGEDLTLTSTQPTREGYAFKGWSTVKDGRVCYSCNSNCSEDADLTLYAVWEESSSGGGTVTYYTITYDANGGSGAPSTQSKKQGEVATISSTIPTKSGYTFAGWSTSSTSTTAEYQAGDSYSDEGNVTLYAVWVEEAVEDGSSFEKAINISLDETVNMSVTSADRTKYYKFIPSTTGTYVFESNVGTSGIDPKIELYKDSDTSNVYGSHDDVDGSNDRNFKLSIELTAGETYYAKVYCYNSNEGNINFSVVKGSGGSTTTYTITFDANDGSGDTDSLTKTQGSSIPIPDINKTRSGYTFVGWSTSSTATTAMYQPEETYTINGNITLYAVWVEDVTEDGSSFEKAIALSLNSTETVTIDTENQEKYYKFTPSASGTYIFESTDDVIDSKIFVYSDINGANQVGYNDDFSDSNRNFKLTIELTSGTTYYVKVRIHGTATGSFNFSVVKEESSPSEADGSSFENAISISLNETVSNDRTSYTYYKFVAPSTSTYDVNIIEQSGSETTSIGIDARLYESSDTSICIAANTGKDFKLTKQLTAGKTYYVATIPYENQKYYLSISLSS